MVNAICGASLAMPSGGNVARPVPCSLPGQLIRCRSGRPELRFPPIFSAAQGEPHDPSRNSDLPRLCGPLCADQVGKVKPVKRLPTEKELTKTLGVSRTCVREAMKSLQALELVSVRAAVGAVVSHPSSGAWFNAYLFAAAIHSEERDAQAEFRKILEVGLVSLAAEKADDTDILSRKEHCRL